MKCPDIETLIALASGRGSSDAADVILHIAACPDCRRNMKIVHETMMTPKWQNPKIVELRQPKQEGGRCSVCGNFYKSKSAIAHTCVEDGCEELICFDCWMRLQVRRCPKHAKAAGYETKIV